MQTLLTQPKVAQVATLHHQLVMFRTWLGGAPGAFTKASLVPSLKAKAQSLSESLRGFFCKSFGVLCHSVQNLCSQEAWGPLDASAPCQKHKLPPWYHVRHLLNLPHMTHIRNFALIGRTADKPWALNRLASVHQIRLDRYYRSDRF